ncbi:hypothetical protein G7Y89_g12665 [Cudoniella acicularis]|uniref:Uncharacterized protein n=1 Tax=Cudoniella acicularis TaxID=354080 RepID=A0A8H4R9Z7_9HELO|nr:hypothetical protein G7Y89_g12665 [Cudoniella acicularis]
MCHKIYVAHLKCAHSTEKTIPCRAKRGKSVFAWLSKCKPDPDPEKYLDDFCVACNSLWAIAKIKNDEAEIRINTYRKETGYLGPITPFPNNEDTSAYLVKDVNMTDEQKRIRAIIWLEREKSHRPRNSIIVLDEVSQWGKYFDNWWRRQKPDCSAKTALMRSLSSSSLASAITVWPSVGNLEQLRPIVDRVVPWEDENEWSDSSDLTGPAAFELDIPITDESHIASNGFERQVVVGGWHP